jgi:hypothetical protein
MQSISADMRTLFFAGRRSKQARTVNKNELLLTVNVLR